MFLKHRCPSPFSDTVANSVTAPFESIFSIPGIGRFYFQAIIFRDYPSVQATALFIALTVLITNIVIDVTYAVIDPRIRFS